jgi:ribosomal protein S12 methylthiotransferase
MKPKTFSIVSLGCFRNNYDSDTIAERFTQRGYRLVPGSLGVHTLVINTCGFIKEAKEESLQAIGEALSLKQQGKVDEVVVEGCLVARYKDTLKKHFPEVDMWGALQPFNNAYPLTRKSIPRHLGFLKISEGCANRCSYCAIPMIKGTLVSKPIEAVLREASFLEREGVKELTIIGQDISSWGKDRYENKGLVDLLRQILRKTKKIPWIRLLYIHPRNLTDSLIDLIAAEDRICNYIDLPIQHINDRILKMMNRGTTKRQIIAMIKKIRRRIPDAVIRTSLIVGLPTEGAREFNELVGFVRHTQFERLGVFMYSREEGTPAYRYPQQVHHQTKKKRFNTLMQVQRDISGELNRRYLGRTLTVLIDEAQRGSSIARSQHSAYEIDGIVYVRDNLKPGTFYQAKITDAYEYDLVAQ